MRCGWRVHSPPHRIALALRSVERHRRSSAIRRCKSAWMIGMHSIPIYMLL